MSEHATNPHLTEWAVRLVAGRDGEDLAVVHGVPARVTRAALTEALEATPLFAKWQARLTTTNRLDVRRTTPLATKVDGIYLISWASLQPRERAMTVRMPSGLYAQCQRAARAAGMPLTEWVRDVLRAELEPADG